MKHIRVQFQGTENVVACMVSRDMTVGCIYTATRPAVGDIDPDGLSVMYDDELWIHADDAGDHVVTRLKYGFVIVD